MCALYLFPTKALAEDQLDEFHGLIEGLSADIRAFTYDGDTPQDARRAIRRPRQRGADQSRHAARRGSAASHALGTVLRKPSLHRRDELHTYRGVFGSHVANLFRRLKRICEFYGSKPQFICCSATIANPKQLAESLIEQPVSEVADNGAPSGEKFFVFYNPPVVNRQLGIRRSYIGETRR